MGYYEERDAERQGREDASWRRRFSDPSRDRFGSDVDRAYHRAFEAEQESKRIREFEEQCRLRQERLRQERLDQERQWEQRQQWEEEEQQCREEEEADDAE